MCWPAGDVRRSSFEVRRSGSWFVVRGSSFVVRRSFGVQRTSHQRTTHGARRTSNRGDVAMCLGVPGLVVEVDELTALVDFWGVRRRVRLDLVDEPVAIGDYVLNHVGFAIRRIPPGDIEGTLALYEQLLKEAGPNDLMAADVRSEVAGVEGAGRAGRAGTT